MQSRQKWRNRDHNGDVRDLLSGKADAMVAYSTNEPFILEQLGAPYQTFSPRAFGIDFYGDSLCTSAQQIKAHPERVRAFRAASLKGWQYALSHKEEIANLILRRYSQKKSREALLFGATKTEALVQPALTELGYQNPQHWQHIAETYRDLGMLNEAEVPDGLIYAGDDGAIPPWVKRTFRTLGPRERGRVKQSLPVQSPRCLGNAKQKTRTGSCTGSLCSKLSSSGAKQDGL
jgi:NMT1/THI5 like